MLFNSKKRINEFLHQNKEQPEAVLSDLRIIYTYDGGGQLIFNPFSRCHLIVFSNYFIAFRYNAFPFPRGHRGIIILTNPENQDIFRMQYKVYYCKNIRFEKGRRPLITITLSDPFNQYVRIQFTFKNIPNDKRYLFENRVEKT